LVSGTQTRLGSSYISGLRLTKYIVIVLPTESLLLEGNKLSGTIPSSLGNLIASGKFEYIVCIFLGAFGILTYMLTLLLIFPEQMTFRRNYLSGRVTPELCELRDEGTLTKLTVDYWVSCDCCTS
jgi:hypothetical protein